AASAGAAGRAPYALRAAAATWSTSGGRRRARWRPRRARCRRVLCPGRRSCPRPSPTGLEGICSVSVSSASTLQPGDTWSLQLSGRDLGGIELSAQVEKPQAYSLSCTRTVAEAVTVFITVKDD